MMAKATSIVVFIFAWMASLGAAYSSDYIVDTGDRIRINISERPDIAGEYIVTESGTVGISRLGRLQVGGLSVEAIEKLIGAKLAGLMEGGEPSVLVDIAAYRPFYVRGDVEKPGAYPYVPGLTVAKALAIAGGSRISDPNAAVLRLEAERTVERITAQILARAEARSRHARLTAEAAPDQADVVFPADLGDGTDPSFAAALQRREQAIFAQRRQMLAADLASLARQEALLREEIESLKDQLAAKRRQAALFQEENRELKNLFDRKLVPSNRFFDARRLEAEVDSAIRELDGRIARASREVVQLGQQAGTLQATRRAEVTAALREAEVQIEAADRAIAAARIQVDVADRGARVLRTQDLAEPGPIMIARRTPEGWVETPAQEFDPVRPDDIIRAPGRIRSGAPARGVAAQVR
jgi:polysaccharide biosynthesis/export protein ExoF